LRRPALAPQLKRDPLGRNRLAMKEGLVATHRPRVVAYLRAFSPLALLIGLAGCSQMARADCAGTPITPGEAMLRVADGRIWYKITGTGRGTPVILLHGGPG